MTDVKQAVVYWAGVAFVHRFGFSFLCLHVSHRFSCCVCDKRWCVGQCGVFSRIWVFCNEAQNARRCGQMWPFTQNQTRIKICFVVNVSTFVSSDGGLKMVTVPQSTLPLDILS